MKMRTLNRWTICGMAGLLGCAFLQSSWAQVNDRYESSGGGGGRGMVKARAIYGPDGKPTGQQVFETYVPADPYAGDPSMGMHPYGHQHAAMGLRGVDVGREIHKDIELLRESKDEETRTKAEKNLRQSLTKFFEDDMKRREADLKQMENRLEKLREQMARRGQKREEIVDLQMKVLINEAEGLGFFGNGSPNAVQPTPSPFSYYSPRPGEPRLRDPNDPMPVPFIQPSPQLPPAPR